jgi:hypothetical protein
VVRRTPITGDTERVSMPEGSTLADIVRVAFPNPEHRGFAIVLLNGDEIPLAMWDIVPKAGDTVALAFRPAGKDFFRTLLQIAVIAVATWVTMGAGGLFAAGSWQAAVAAAGVTILGNLAINALIPIKQPSAPDSPPPYYSLSGSRNTARPFDTVPMLFGTHRIVPPRMSEPVQEVIGGLTYLRFALCLGLCPMEATDWKIGETALSSYSNVEMEVRLNEDDPAHTLLTGDPSQEAVGSTLNHTEWVTRTTAADSDEIEVIVDFPSGLGGVDSKNRKTQRQVGLYIEYRPTGSSEPWLSRRPNVPQANHATSNLGVPWRPAYLTVFSDLITYGDELNDIGAPGGAWIISRADPGRGFRAVERWAVPRGQYDVRVMRTSAASADSNVVDATVWSVLSSIKSQVDPFPNRKLATAVFRIKATDQLTGMVDTVNCIASSLQPVFSAEALADPAIADAGEFTDVASSSNPAHLALLASRGPNTAFPKPDAEIDWPAWADAAAWFAAQGLTFNEYVEGKIGRWEMVSRILAAGHARPVKHNGRLSVVIDRSRAGEAPAQTFTPRNVRNFRWRKTYPRLPHALRVAFADAARNWQADEVTIYLPGYSAETATRFESLPMPGKTDVDEIRTVANQYARNAHFQTESFEFETDAEHLASKRGDFVVIQHFAMATGIGAGRVVAREVDGGGDVTAVVLDTPLDTPESGALALQWRAVVVESGAARMEVMDEKPVTRDAANPRRFVFDTPLAPGDAPAVPAGDYEGDIALVGLAGKVSIEALIADIEPRAHLQAAIRCVAYAGERFVDAPDWPAHNPRVTLPYAPRPTAPVAGTPSPRTLEIAVPFTQPEMPHGVRLTGYVIAWREHGEADDTWEPLGGLGPDERIAITPPGDPGASYDVRIVAIGMREDGVTVYSDALVVEEIEAVTAPVAPTGCNASFTVRESASGIKQLVLSCDWDAVEDPEILDTKVEMLVSEGPDVWGEIGSARAALGSLELHGLQVGRDYDIGFVHLSRRGAASVRTTVATITAADILAAANAGGIDWADVTGAGKPADNATKNITTWSGTAPSSPTDGDVWIDTSSTPNVIKVRVSGAWRTGGTVGGTFGVDLLETGGGATATLANFKTLLGVAASITGQGWGATASQSAADNGYTLTPGANAARYSRLEGGGVVGWAVINGGYGGSPAVSRKTSGVSTTAKPGLNFNNTSGSNGQVYYGSFGSHYSGTAGVYLLPVKSGERVQVAARVLELTGSCTGVLIRALQCDTAGAGVTELTSTAGLATPSSVAAAGRVGCFATASQDGFIAIVIYAQKLSATTAAGGVTVDEMFISKARTGQVEIDPYTPGPSSQAGADITANNVALSVVGQGALALLNSLAYGGGYLTGFGALAAKATIDNSALVGSGVIVYTALASTAVRLGTNITRADGSTSLTDALAVTTLGISAGFAGQGAVAVLNTITGAYLGAGAGANQLYDTRFRKASTYWAISENITGSIASQAPFTTTDGERGYVVTCTGATSAGQIVDAACSAANRLPCVENDRIEGQALIAGVNFSNCRAFITFRNAAGAQLLSTSLGDIGRTLDGTGGLATFHQLFGIATAPAGTASAELVMRARCDGTSAPVVRYLRPLLRVAHAGQTERTPWHVGFDGEAGADPTGSYVAASVTGQGALALLNSLAYGGGYLTGFGALAAKATIDNAALVGSGVIVYTALATTAVRLGTNITRADGSTSLTETLVITTLGVSLAISGQGNFATSNFYVQEAEPSSPQNGWWWAEVDPEAEAISGYLKVRVAGSWVVVATISPPAPPPAVGNTDTIEINSTFDQELCSGVVGPTATGDRIRVSVFLSSEEEAAGSTGMIWSVYFGTTLLATGALNITSAGEIVFTDDPADALRGSFPAAHSGPDTVYLYLRKTNSGHDDRNVSGELFVEVLRTDYSVLLP